MIEKFSTALKKIVPHRFGKIIWILERRNPHFCKKSICIIKGIVVLLLSYHKFVGHINKQ